MNTFSLEEKSVIIIGGLGGYGLAITSLILKRGGRVLLADLKAKTEADNIISSRFPEACEAKTLMYTKCDVTSEADLEAAFQFANGELVLPDRSVEILINAAGIVGEQRWEQVYQVNIVGLSPIIRK